MARREGADEHPLPETGYGDPASGPLWGMKPSHKNHSMTNKTKQNPIFKCHIAWHRPRTPENKRHSKLLKYRLLTEVVCLLQNFQAVSCAHFNVKA